MTESRPESELSLAEMAFVLLGSLQTKYPDQLYSILRAGTALPPESTLTYPPELFVADDGSFTVLSLINTLLVALGQPKVAIECPTGPAGEVLPTVCGVLLLNHNDEVICGCGDEDEGGEGDEVAQEGGEAVPAAPPPTGPAPGGNP